jgi:NTE family protein
LGILVIDRTDGVPPRWPTFGVKIIPKLPVDQAKLLPLLAAVKIPPVDFLASLVLTMVVGRDQTYLRKPWVTARTMQVDTGGINPADFGLDDQ